MSFIRVPQSGQYGVNRDLSTHELPSNVWTDAVNIRFIDGMASSVGGNLNLYTVTPITPFHVLPVDVSGVRTWLYAGEQKMYTIANGGVHTNITRQTASIDVNYTATRNSWTSSVLGGIPILNNGYDVPQMWPLTGLASDLTNWPATNRAVAVRTYKNSLIALNITKGSTKYPYMVKWSHPAQAGTVPVTWDIADATKDAGEFDLSEGYDAIVDGLPLRDSFIIYKQASIWRMDYTGGIYVYRFQKIVSNQGALTRNCVAEVDGKHFVFSNSDCIIHDGQTAVSVLDKVTRRDLFTQINPDYVERCFVFVNRLYNEVFACFPALGATICNKALVWNYVDKTVSFRDLSTVNHADNGPVDTSANNTWATITGTWASIVRKWGSQYPTLNRSLSVLATDGSYLVMLDGVNLPSSIPSLERRGLSLGEPESIKLVRSIRPRIYGTSGVVSVYVGSSITPYADPTYAAPVSFNIGSTVSIDVMVTGRYIAVKFTAARAVVWRLDSYDIDVQKVGSW